MTDRELMQQALDAMLNFPNDISDEMFESIRVLRARLAQPEQKHSEQWWRHEVSNAYANGYEKGRASVKQPEQEPVAQVRIAEDYHAHVFWMVSPLKLDQRYLYAAPRSWQGLTDEEYTTIMQQADHDAAKTGSVFQNLRHAIEAKLKEKNG